MDNIANQATLLYNNMTTNSNTVTTQILSLYDLTATKEPLLASSKYEKLEYLAVTDLPDSTKASIVVVFWGKAI